MRHNTERILAILFLPQAILLLLQHRQLTAVIKEQSHDRDVLRLTSLRFRESINSQLSSALRVGSNQTGEVSGSTHYVSLQPERSDQLNSQARFDIAGTRDTPQFVFLIGLEGSGHHLFADLVKESPVFSHLRTSGAKVKHLQALLYDQSHQEDSLWGLPCAKRTSEADQVFQNVVNSLREIGGKVRMPIPINSFYAPVVNNDTFAETKPKRARFVRMMVNKGQSPGMMSYPNWKGT